MGVLVRVLTWSLLFLLTACGGGGGGSTPAPSASITSLNPAPAYTHQAISFTAEGISATNTDSALIYEWSFGDGTSASSANSTHTYAAAGEYTVQLQVSEGNSAKAIATQTLVVSDAPPNTAPSLSVSNTTSYPNRALTFYASAVNPDHLAMTYEWNFGDGQTAAGSTIDHVFLAEGTYTVTVLATDSNNHSLPMASTTITVLSATLPVTVNDVFVPDCSGLNCGASDAHHYSGQGLGVWRYNNTQDTDATLNVDISGLSSSNKVTLVYTNGNNSYPISVPFTAALSPFKNASSADGQTTAVEDFHNALLLNNQRIAREMIERRGKHFQIQALGKNKSVVGPAPTPSIGSTKSWIDSYSGIKTYSAKVHFVCPLPDGRKAIFWLDQSAGVSDVDMNTLETIFCGEQGAYAMLTNLMGEPWGAAATNDATLIQDLPDALQPINIVLLNAPKGSPWAGYYSSGNNLTKATNPNSNEALTVFVDANQFKSSANYTRATLIHEAVHLFNFYQHSVANSETHDMWLEETSAMMGEDMIVPHYLDGYDEMITLRLPGYLSTGGSLSLVNWQYAQNISYNLGGSFGSFINRRYGSSIFSHLNGPCLSMGDQSSYGCFDALLKANGGYGFADEFARFGASTFAGLRAKNLPIGYGFPAIQTGDLALLPIDISKMLKNRPATGQYTNPFPATSHRYELISLPAGQTQWVKNNIVVPAKSILMVVVQ